jgi:hypothetical protein
MLIRSVDVYKLNTCLTSSPYSSIYFSFRNAMLMESVYSSTDCTGAAIQIVTIGIYNGTCFCSYPTPVSTTSSTCSVNAPRDVGFHSTSLPTSLLSSGGYIANFQTQNDCLSSAFFGVAIRYSIFNTATNLCIDSTMSACQNPPKTGGTGSLILSSWPKSSTPGSCTGSRPTILTISYSPTKSSNTGICQQPGGGYWVAVGCGLPSI